MGKDVKERVGTNVNAQIAFHKKTAGAGAALGATVGATLGALAAGTRGAAAGGAIGGGVGGYFGAKMAKKKPSQITRAKNLKQNSY